MGLDAQRLSAVASTLIPMCSTLPVTIKEVKAHNALPLSRIHNKKQCCQTQEDGRPKATQPCLCILSCLFPSQTHVKGASVLQGWMLQGKEYQLGGAPLLCVGI